MKRNILIMMSLLYAVTSFAQSSNPLNYSGKMFISSIDVLSTPRYISYEEHAIINREMTVPVTEVTKVIFDFEKNIINLNDKDHDIKVTSLKKYETDDGWLVVLYIDFIGEADKYELVWREFGTPFLQEITRTDDGVDIARMNLSTQPTSTSPDAAILQMLGNLGSF